jgi:phosphoglycolate phosphatase
MHARFLEFYGANIAVGSVPFPGVEAAMDQLSRRGVLLAVCTNKYESLAIDLLRKIGMAERFVTIVGGDTFGVSKPDPRHLTQTVEAAGGGQTLMIGDSEADVGAAKAAGIPCVAVSFGYSPVPARELGADAVIDHFDELDACARRYLEA